MAYISIRVIDFLWWLYIKKKSVLSHGWLMIHNLNYEENFNDDTISHIEIKSTALSISIKISKWEIISQLLHQ